MPVRAANQYNLVADVGGTNTRVALARGSELLTGSSAKFTNKNFPDLGAVLAAYISEQGGVDCAGACVAVAGPVRDGAGHLTNLDWFIDRAMLSAATSAVSVAVLNDLQAQGHGLPNLHSQALTNIVKAKSPPPNSARLVIGMGTGFNAAVVYDLPDMLLVPPSECGHGDLPVQTVDDLGLADHIRQEHGFCAIDDVLSGRGLERIYHWHSQQAGEKSDATAALIMGALKDGSDPIAVATARHFIHLAAVTIGNLALTYLPFGGLYLAGGVSRAFVPHFAEFGFDKIFREKGRFSEFMDNFAVSVIEDDDAALSGCASYLYTLHQ